MKNILVIGDVHGKYLDYKEIIDKHNGESIQLGDFGFNFVHDMHLSFNDVSKHKVLFGNHDDYTYLNREHSLGNFFIKDDLMCIRGADSIDKRFRTINVDWWENEELSYKEMEEVINVYELNKPKIVISHDGPQSIIEELFGIRDKSLTRQGLEQMLGIHTPNIWIFGHHHKSIDITINGCRFICLNELETFLL